MGARLKVLVVDDEANIRWCVQEELVQMGHEVQTSSSVEEACEILDAEEFDVVLSDIHMPGSSGLVFGDLLKDTRAPVFPIAMTGMTAAEEMCREHGFKAMLQKPFSCQDLAEVLSLSQMS